MKEVVLLPFGDQSHIELLLDHLSRKVEAGREQDFALLLPTSQLLHNFRARLVKTVSRRLNLTTFDELVAAALEAASPDISGIDSQTVTEAIALILENRGGELLTLGRYAGSLGMARNLSYTLGQLCRAKVSDTDLAHALQASKGDPLLGDLLTVWREYTTFLAQGNLADIEAQYALAAENLASVPWLGAVREFHVCWFFDFEPLQLDILDRLSSHTASTTVWLPYQHPAHGEYINRTVESLRELGFSVRRQPGQSRGPLTENLFAASGTVYSSLGVQALAAPRVKQELELVAREVKKLAAGGASPQDICLFLPDQHKYLPPMRRMYREYGIDLAMPLVADLTAVPWVREVLALWRAAAAGWDRDSLLRVAGSAYITAHLPLDYDADSLEWAIYSLGGDRRGRKWLARLDQEIESSQMEGHDRQHIESLAMYQKARAGIEAWVQGVGSLLTPCTPQDHCQLILGLLEDNAAQIAPQGDSEEDLRDRLALDKVTNAVRDYLSCCKLLKRQEPISPGQFADDLTPWLEQDLSLERSSPGAVQVLSPAQARGVTSKYVFVLGMNQGTFPRLAQEHWLLDRIARLPGLARASASIFSLDQEKIFFHSCVAAAEVGLYLSRLLPGVDQEAEASSFWREVDLLLEGGILPQEGKKNPPRLQTLSSSDLLPQLKPGFFNSRRQLVQRLIYDFTRGEQVDSRALGWLAAQEDYPGLVAASTAEQRREGPEPSDNMDGVLSGSSTAALADKFGRAIYSISRLEQYSRCPFSFFARYVLGLGAAPRDVEDYSPLDRGILLHWLLEHFYTAYLDQADIQRPKTIRAPLEALSRRWLEERGLNPEDILWRLRARDAVKLAQALIETDLSWLARTGLCPVLHEASFGMPDSKVAAIRPGGGQVSFRGKIDRIDILERGGETWAVVYDYKTSSAITQKDIIAGKSMQIPVYLAAAPALLADLGFLNVRIMGGGYYVIKDAKLAGGIWNKEFSTLFKSKLGSLEQQGFDNLENTLIQAAEGLHQGIIAGRFAPDPNSSACGWCEFKNCCRYDKNRLKLKKGGQGNATQCGTTGGNSH